MRILRVVVALAVATAACARPGDESPETHDGAPSPDDAARSDAGSAMEGGPALPDDVVEDDGPALEIPALDAPAPDAPAPDIPAPDAPALDIPAPDEGLDVTAREAATMDRPAAVDLPAVDAPGVDGPGDGGDVPPRLPLLEDFSLGPYPSALGLLLASLRAQARALDTASSYGHSAAQGYLLQALARTLQAARGRLLPGGEATRDELVTLALREVDELVAASRRVRGGAPGFGLETAWDAFGDGSTNPAFTNYAWQTGMVATGVAELLAYLRASGDRHADRARDVARMTAFLRDLIVPWGTRYTAVAGATEPMGYFWYSFEPADAKATHNTTALIATASLLYGDLTGDGPVAARARPSAALLRARWRITAAGGYAWNYVDDGYPVARRRPEDVSHALLTLQFMRLARDRGWYTDGDMGRVATTLLTQMWSGHPARMNGYVDGSPGGDDAWTWTRAAVLGLAAHADAPGGRPEVFDYARSALVSSHLTRYGVPRAGGSVAAVQADALATLLLHRPAVFRPDSRWSREAGAGDTAASSGGVRFYRVDWAPPAVLARGDGLELLARQATAVNANVLADLPEGGAVPPVAVSITYRATEDGVVEQWDGRAYRRRAPLPATRHDDGTVRWMRSTWVLDPAVAFDYEPGVPGRNVLFQFTSRIAVHRIEATPLR